MKERCGVLVVKQSDLLTMLSGVSFEEIIFALDVPKNISRKTLMAGGIDMTLHDAVVKCHVRGAVYRKSKGVKYWKNHQKPIIEQVPHKELIQRDWEVYDPADEEPRYHEA